MLITIVGIIANIASLLVWVPQVKSTWINRNNAEVLAGISMGTQIIALITTTSWFIYGILTNSIWVSLGFFFTFPLVTFNIYYKIRSKKLNKI